MAHKNHYKKIFVLAAALFVLLAPVGMTISGGMNGSGAAPALAPTSLRYSSFRLSFNVNLAEATDTATTAVIGQTGTSAGTNPPNVFSCITSPATCGVYYVSLVVNGAMGLILMGGAFLVKLGLQFNDNIFDAPAVQIGFSVSLAIANLGFVLGIIIIAIATIIRNQTYGIKQLLWKLVMMAILVNFGLVITAPIVGFANNMSTYFVNATSPSATTGGYGEYVSTMMNAFNPQAVNEAPAAPAASSGGTLQAIAGAACPHWLAVGSPLTLLTGGVVNPISLRTACAIGGVSTTDPNDHIWQSTMALFFDIAFSGIAAFAFICLAILLIIRYLMLGGLLIILPLAWLTYVFPKFDNSFSKWWDTFIKWVFFPPLALFFIYLAFTTAALTGGTNTTPSSVAYTAAAVGGIGTASNPDPKTDPLTTLTSQTGLSGGIFEQAADEVLLVGLMIMGLMFALSLAGKAGSTVVNGATTVSKAAAGYVGKKTGKAAARVYQKAGGNDLNAALQRNRIPGVSAIGRGMTNLTESATKNQVDARHKALGLGAMDDARLQAVTEGLHGKEDQLAAVQEWQKRGKIDKIEKIGGGNFKEWLGKNQGTFKDYSQGKLSGDIDTAMGSNDKIRKIAEVTGGARATLSAEEIEKITNSAEVVDKNGFVNFPNQKASAKRLAEAAKTDDGFIKAQATLDDPDSSKNEKKEARKVVKKFQDAIDDADAAIAKAINEKVDDVDVVDKENLLGRGTGKTAKAGEFRKLMDTESETFWGGKDKGDAAKVKSNAIFGDKPKFGFDKETLNEIGRSLAHGIVTQMPSAMGSIAGKLDNSKQLEAFTSVYKTGIEDARRLGKINERRAKDLNDALKKVLAGKLAYMGMGGPESAPVPTPTPNP
jgi:hypothetical protein